MPRFPTSFIATATNRFLRGKYLANFLCQFENFDVFTAGNIYHLVFAYGAVTVLASLSQLVYEQKQGRGRVINSEVVTGFFSGSIEPHGRLSSYELMIQFPYEQTALFRTKDRKKPAGHDVQTETFRIFTC